VRVVFFGFRGWGLPALEAAAEDHEVVAIITHPEEVEQFNKSFPESVEDFGARHGIPTVVSGTGREPLVEATLEKAKPDIILSSNWRRRMEPGLLGLARLGGLNVHRSLLPMYAGFAPINWAIARGETVTGVTIHAMTDGVDEGEIVVQERLVIAPDDTATTIFHKMTPIARRLVKLALQQVESGTATLVAQDPTRVQYFSKRTERDLRINWNHSRSGVLNLVRAQSAPFPSASTLWKGGTVFVEAAQLAERCYRGTPGRIVGILSEGIVVLCGDCAEAGGQGLLVTSVRVVDSDSINPAVVIRSITESFE
jgi:methionyl-tRNA formyltransferase